MKTLALVAILTLTAAPVWAASQPSEALIEKCSEVSGAIGDYREYLLDDHTLAEALDFIESSDLPAEDKEWHVRAAIAASNFQMAPDRMRFLFNFVCLSQAKIVK